MAKFPVQILSVCVCYRFIVLVENICNQISLVSFNSTMENSTRALFQQSSLSQSQLSAVSAGSCQVNKPLTTQITFQTHGGLIVSATVQSVHLHKKNPLVKIKIDSACLKVTMLLTDVVHLEICQNVLYIARALLQWKVVIFVRCALLER